MCKDCQNDTVHSDQPLELSLNRRTLLKVGIATAAVTTLQGGLAMFELLPTAQAAGPTIASTSTWGAQAARGTITVLAKKTSRILVHHTAGANSTDYSQSHAYSLARGIQQSHFDRGWIDSGQQFTISRGGYIMEGRHKSLSALNSGTQHVLGAHCPIQNEDAIGIENEGTYTSVQPPIALWNSLVNLCVYICQQYGISATAIFSHRDFDNTSCPGTELYSRLPELRRTVASRLGQTITGRTWPVHKNGMSGEVVRSIQYLLGSRGYSVSVDSSFGSGTENSVKSFQSAQGFTADGIVGKQTWEALITTIRNGSSGDAVRAAQSQLNWKGYSTSVDGQFGSGTETTVKAFQTHYGLTADGIVGANTWCALIGGIVG